MEFQNQQLDISLLPTVQDIQYESLDIAYRKVNIISTAIFFALILIVYLIVSIFVHFLLSFPWILLFLSTWTLFTTLFMVLSIKSYDYQGYAIRDKDIIYKTGIFFRSSLIIPFNRIQHCEIEQGPIDRLFGLAELSLFTAGGSGSDLKIPGLAQDRANSLKNYITNKVAQDEEE